MKKAANIKEFDSKDTIAARVPLDEMVIDKSYQGGVNMSLVKKIAANWKEASSGAVILNMREDGTFAVLDGQHRYLAAKLAGITELNALCFVGKPHAEEARLFVELNTKHQVMPLDRFRANLQAGAKREMEIQQILNDLGLKLAHFTNKDATAVRAVASVTKVYDGFGAQHLKMTLGVLQSAFSNYKNNAAYSLEAIEGAAQFLYRYPEAEIKKLIEKLSTYSPTTINGMAAQSRARGEFNWQSWGRVITNIYNSGMRMSSEKYLDKSRWDKKVYSPAGKKIQKEKYRRQMAAPRSAEQLKKYQFKKGVPRDQQTAMLAAKKVKG